MRDLQPIKVHTEAVLHGVGALRGREHLVLNTLCFRSEVRSGENDVKCKD